MPPDHYNPCADGLAAKAWECLRRNEAFLAYCDEWLEAKSGDDAETVAGWYFSDKTHPFHRAALGHLVGFDPLRPGDELARLGTRHSWRELKVEMQTDFEEALSWNDACKVPTPDWPVINPFKPKNSSTPSYSADAHRKFLEQLEEQSITHDFIAVPKIVWNPDHRKEIELQVGKLLNKPIGTVKSLKPTYSTLGTRAEWDAYLLFEEWTLHYGRGKACGLASWERYVPKAVRQDFGKDPKTRKQKADEFCASPAGENEPKYKDKIEGQVVCIEKAIESVFPVFAPVKSKK